MPYWIDLDQEIKEHDIDNGGDPPTYHDIIAHPDQLSPEVLTVYRDFVEKAQSHLAHLSPEHRQVARLAFDEGLGAEQIAHLTGYTRRTVENLLDRLRRKLREKLGRPFGNARRQQAKAERIRAGQQLRDGITRADHGVEVVIRYKAAGPNSPSVAVARVGSDSFLHKGRSAVEGVLEKLKVAHKGKTFAAKGSNGVFRKGVIGVESNEGQYEVASD